MLEQYKSNSNAATTNQENQLNLIQLTYIPKMQSKASLL